MGCWRRPARRAPIVERLNKELRAALATEEVRKRIINEGGEPEPTTPEEHAAVIDREETKWSAVIRAAGIRSRSRAADDRSRQCRLSRHCRGS